MNEQRPLDPNEIPEDADGGDLAAYIGEDIGRIVMLRLTAFAALVTLVAGIMSESASSALKAACLLVGGGGAALLLLAQLFRWPRRTQWLTIGGVLIACVGLVATVFVGSR